MSSIVASDQLLSMFANLHGVTEVRGPDGRTLGFYAPVEPVVSAQKSYTLNDALGWLDALDKEMQRRQTAGEKQLNTEEGLAFFRALRGQPRNIRQAS